jgi:peptidoglycan/LPS O-acetylase OafA/YrhL
MKTIESAYKSGQDNFLFIRAFAATMVIYGHSYAIADPPGERGRDLFQIYIGGTYSGTIAVQMFFMISGLLVTASFINRDNVLAFLKSRALRIFPALIVSVVLTALVMGPIFTTVPIGEYLTNRDVYDYIFTNISLITNEWYLPGVFSDNPIGGVNGSLWTLPAEARMYLMVAALGALGLLKKRALFNAAALLMLFLGIYEKEMLFFVSHASHYKVVPFFLLGAVFYVNRDLIYLDANILLLLFALCFITHGTPGFQVAFAVFLAYFTIWVCYVPNLRFYNRFGDYSYGLYVYAFPITQMIRQVYGPVHPLELFAYSFLATLVVAIISWKYVEQPFLKLKKVRFRKGALDFVRENAGKAKLYGS